MKKILFLTLNLCTLILCAQQLPKVYINDTIPLRLAELRISVELVGNTATISYDMQFQNSTDETLQGELKFPLSQGQDVSQFRMEINGSLRDAVIVEKEKARVAFESTVKRQIDPALLERSEGNNYSARVYPILPHANKRLVITTEQDLLYDGKKLNLKIPLVASGKLDVLEINLSGYDSAEHLEIRSDFKELKAKPNSNGFEASVVVKNIKPNSEIQISKLSEQGKIETSTYQNYFYSTLNIEPTTRLKTKPKKLLLLWDNSYSMRNRNIDEEIKLLDGYFKYLISVEVQLLQFGTVNGEPFSFHIIDSDWQELKKYIQNITYDGGTSFPIVNSPLMQTDEILMFSDGIFNLDNNSKALNVRTYNINSISSANHSKLYSLASDSGGSYINLNAINSSEALNILKSQPYQYLGFAGDKGVSEVYPSTRQNVRRDFSIGGKFDSNSNIKLLFGYEDEVTDTVSLDIKRKSGSKTIKRLWAKKKLIYLENDGEINRQKIIELAKDNHLITNFTSMLILDRIDDYVRFKIEPPAEMRKEYKSLLADATKVEQDRIEDLKDKQGQILEDYQTIQKWYKTNYPLKDTKRKKVVEVLDDDSPVTTQNQNNRPPRPQMRITNPTQQVLDSTRNIVSGTILDEAGIELPGVNVVVEGTTRGTQTDFDGRFSINVEPGENLVISYLGYVNNKVEISNDRNLSLKLEEDAAHLDEVVVVGYGSSAAEALSGTVSGVTINRAVGASSDDVSIRGSASISANSQPIYIVDGNVVEDDPTQNLKPDDIESIQVVKGDNATQLYGAQAVNGLVIVTTKNGMTSNSKKINELNEKIADKIELKAWDPSTPYLEELEVAKNPDEAYQKYLEIRSTYSNIPAFFLDVSDFFGNKNRDDLAIRVLSNLAELEINNYELLRAMAYKMDALKRTDLAVNAYQKILDMRPEDIQSYRDLALSYERNEQYQEAYDTMLEIVSGELLDKDPDDMYPGILEIVMVELNHLLSMHGDKIQTRNGSPDLGKKLELDIRVLIDWNHNDTDIDLWVTDPDGEKVFYDNPMSYLGGHLSEDMMDGFGPEEYMIKEAKKGKYFIEADYYSEDMQKISGPTILKATIYTNYGRETESVQIMVFTLGEEDDELEIGSVNL